MKKYYKNMSWLSYDLPRVLKERGVLDANKLPGFYYRDDALRMWMAIKDYVRDIVSIYYHSEKDIERVSITANSLLSRSFCAPVKSIGQFLFAIYIKYVTPKRWLIADL